MIFKLLLIQASLFACGMSLFTIGVLAWRRPTRWWGYASVKAAVLLTVGTVMWRILLQPSVSLDAHDFYTDLYSIGVLLADVGLVVVSRDMLKHAGRRVGMGLPPADYPGPLGKGFEIEDVLPVREEWDDAH